MLSLMPPVVLTVKILPCSNLFLDYMLVTKGQQGYDHCLQVWSVFVWDREYMICIYDVIVNQTAPERKNKILTIV